MDKDNAIMLMTRFITARVDSGYTIKEIGFTHNEIHINFEEPKDDELGYGALMDKIRKEMGIK